MNIVCLLVGQRRIKMYSAIFSVAFLVAAALVVFIGVMRARKKVWQLSLVRIIMTFSSAMMSAFIAMIISWFGMKGIVNALVDGNSLGQFGEMMSELPALTNAVLAFMSMILTPVFFLVVYAIIRPVTGAFVKPITRAISKKGKESGEEYDKKTALQIEKAHWLSGLLGGVGALLMFCVLLVPLNGTLEVIDDMGSLALQSASESSGIEGFSIGAEVLEGAAHNAGNITVKCMGGGLLYDMMTSYPHEGEFVTLKKESGFIKSVANATVYLVDEDSDKSKTVKALKDVSVSFDKSVLMPEVLAEVVGAATEDWKAGNSYYGISIPTTGNKNLDPVVLLVVDGLSTSDKNTIKEDVNSIVNIVCTLVENDVISKLSGGDRMAILADEDTTAQIMLELLKNPRLCVVVDGLSDYGIDLFLTSLHANSDKNKVYRSFVNNFCAVNAFLDEELAAGYKSVFENYAVRNSGELVAAAVAAKNSGTNMLQWAKDNVADNADTFMQKNELVLIGEVTSGIAQISDAEAESKTLAKAYSQIYSLYQKVDDDGFKAKDMLLQMGPVFDTFAKSETVGQEKTKLMLVSMFQGDYVCDNVGFTVLEATDSAKKIADNSAKKSYEAMLKSVSLAVDVVEATNANKTKEEIDKAVENMLADLTPESAEIMVTITTPDTVKKYGVSDTSAKPVSDMVSSTFTNLAHAKENGMSEEEYKKESAAVSDMMNMMMSAGADQGKNTFGEGSYTNQSAEQFIGNIMDSKVMSQTVIDTVYADGDTPIHDPLKSNRVLGEGEETEFINAVNTKWSASDKSAEVERELIAIAAITNVNIALEADVWVIVE